MTSDNRPDYEEILLEAMNIISKKQVESVSFDRTIEAVVTDASRASDGVYVVSTGESKFTAYSTETEYKVNDAVMVTVPQGDFDKQKMIIGKQIDNNNTPMVYRSPFQQLVNVSNNLIYGDMGETGFWANKDINPFERTFGWNTNIVEFKDSSSYTGEVYDDTVDPPMTRNFDTGLIWQIPDPARPNEEFFKQGYTRIGLSAQFSTWLTEFNTAAGNYGLALKITFKCIDIPDDTENPGANKFSKYVTFDSDEFFGNVYDFQTYYTQEKLFDISEFIDFPIVGLQLYAYQRNNFVDVKGNPIGYEDDVFGNIGNPNIFIKDPYVCLGIAVEEFDTDTANIITQDTLFYYKDIEDNDTYSDRTENNTKTLDLQWIHKDAVNNVIKTVQQNEMPADYEIRWYRYQLGARSPDQFAGAHWARFYGCKTIPNENEDWCITEEDLSNNDNVEDIATNCIDNIVFVPNINNQTEQLKAIVLKKEDNNIYRRIAATAPILFTNNTDVRSQATIIDMNALAIRYEDDEKGNYFLYNRAGEITSGENFEIRILTALFDPNENNLNNKAELTECTSIKWYFPTQGTMIVPMTGIGPDATEQKLPEGHENDEYIIFENNSGGITTETENNLFQVGYTIRKNLKHTYTNNTVKLEINKDGQIYTADVQMRFGTAGTSGSDYTLFVEWVRNDLNPQGNAINLSKRNGVFLYNSSIDENGNATGNTTELRGNIYLMDQSGNLVDIPLESEFEADWYVAECGEDYTQMAKEEEVAEIYYPVFKNNDSVLLDVYDSNNPDFNYQGEGYYYFIDTGNDIGNDYYTFNPVSNGFEPISYNSNEILYRKVRENEPLKKKLEFRQVNFPENIFDQERGVLDSDYNNENKSINIVWKENSQNYEKKYCYKPNQKYFIKINDKYILDPWDTYQEVETYYEPIEAKEVVYENPENQIDINIEDNNIIVLTAHENVTMNSIWVLRLILNDFGDYPLVALYPIALKNRETLTSQINYIDGPTFVRYACNGETDFNKNPYNINATNMSDYFYSNGGWEIACPDDNHNITRNPQQLNELNDNFLPSLKEDDSGNVFLQPPSVYIPNGRPYAVQYITRQDSNSNGEIYWSQSILVYEDNYPSTTLNKWNGKEIVTDEEAGTITANGFSAGKKERDNTFSGVVIGDWSRSDVDTAISKNTGIYGFNHGSMSYAFKDDGTGFIGKDGKGRIFLDGNKSQIFSSNWANGNTQVGMLLDIDDGYIKMNSPIVEDSNQNEYVFQQSVVQYVDVDNLDEEVLNQWKFLSNNQNATNEDIKSILKGTTNITGDVYVYSSGQYISKTGTKYNVLNSRTKLYIPKIISTQNFITIDATAKRYPLAIGSDKNIFARGFRVKWDGTTYINNGEFSGLINAKGGTISGDLTVSSTLHGGILEADELYVYRGKIGGWHINSSTLESENGSTVLSASIGITTNKVRIDETVNNNSVQGTFGSFLGNSADGNTSTIGIGSTTNSIVLQTGSGNDKYIRLSGPGSGTDCQGIDLQARVISLGKSTPTGGPYTTQIWFYAEPNNQHGIYARFA